MMIQWYKTRSNQYAKINKNNIILNSTCTKLLTEYAYCRIGFSENKKSIYIQPVSYDVVENNSIDSTIFKVYNTRTYSRISCTDFIKEVSKQLNCSFIKDTKYNVLWEEEEKLFTIELQSEVKNDD